MATTFNRIADAGDLTGKTALVRVDFNVPMENGAVTDDTRLRAAVDTVNTLRTQGAKVALLAHFGRPKGARVAEMSLAPIAGAFAQVLGSNVSFVADCKGAHAKAAIDDLAPAGVILLENTRFYAGEESGDLTLAKEIAELGDVYVNDAFSAAHRKHVSTAVLADLLPAYAGVSMERELDALEAALGTPVKPVLAVVGGAKVSSKIELLKNLVTQVDALAIGGGMANTFLAARGHDVGKSLCEHDLKDLAQEIEQIAGQNGCKIVLPTDLVVAKDFAANAANRVCGLDDVASDEMILDAGPDTVAALDAVMAASKTLVWNGPLGAFEMTPFDKATVAAAQAAAKRAKSGNLTAVAGGGDTVAALNHAGVSEDFTFVSTAGGAFLEWMEGKPLPGVDALRAEGTVLRPKDRDKMANVKMAERMSEGAGFVAALDQSGGSTPKALGLYGVQSDAWSNDEEMFGLVHDMRARIVKSPAFTGDMVIGAILFERTMDGDIDGMPTATYLWEQRGVVPFLKVDKGLADAKDGVKLMNPNPGLDALLERAVSKGIFGTKMRSVIDAANPVGIAANVAQQFEVGKQILGHGLMPIIEPEVTITISDKAEAEDILLAEITKQLDALPDDQQVMLKLTLPEKANQYKSLVDHPRVMRVVALSGGYSREEANNRLCKNNGIIASFSRALSEGLSAQQSEAEFDAMLANSIECIRDASCAG